MQVIHSPLEIFRLSQKFRSENKVIGLVPTMGALHQGHFQLIKSAQSQCDVIIVSIFVNPLQFNKQEDLENYPRDLEADLESIKLLDVDMVFAPEENQIYPQNPIMTIDFGSFSSFLEGEYRPGHFSGVALIVAKLFNLTNPSKAFFGLKDLQQYLLIRRLAHDLSYSIEIIGVPIVRETSGLALSSRNQRLSEKGKETAGLIYKGLEKFKELMTTGKDLNETKKQIIDFYKKAYGFELEYLEVVDPETLDAKETNDGTAIAICVAGYVEGIRLIDNLYLRQY